MHMSWLMRKSVMKRRFVFSYSSSSIVVLKMVEPICSERPASWFRYNRVLKSPMSIGMYPVV